MKGSRHIRGASILAATLVIVAATSVAQAGISVKKLYTADISPHSVNTSSSVTFTATVGNKAATQMLGSCNITAPSGFTLQSTGQPSTGTASISGSILMLRNLSTPAMTSRTVSFVAATPASPGVYTWTIECRQANNFTPDQPSNQFSLDAANSNLKTTVSQPLPQADLAVSQTGSPGTVSGANTVQYDVTVTNNGPAGSGLITLVDSLPSGGSMYSISGTDWTCGSPGSSVICTHASIGGGSSAPVVRVLVTAPTADTTINNHAHVSGAGTADPNGANNDADVFTTVTKDTSCPSGQIACGVGQIVYGIDSQVVAGTSTNITRFAIATTMFKGVPGMPGGQTWGMFLPTVPGSFCPLNFADTAVTQCSWEVHAQPLPALPVGNMSMIVTCDKTRCPVNPVAPGVGTIVVILHEDGSHQIVSRCSGPSDTNLCFTQERNVGGHLKITVFNLPPGDPRVAGVCLGGGC